MSFSVKIEPTDDEKSDNEQEPELVIDDEQEMHEEQDNKSEIHVERNKIDRQQPLITAPATVSDLYSAIASVPRNCDTCGIKFTYLKSYLAHKEFYCKERNNNGAVMGGGGVSAKGRSDELTSPNPSNGLNNSTVTNSRAAEVQ